MAWNNERVGRFTVFWVVFHFATELNNLIQSSSNYILPKGLPKEFIQEISMLTNQPIISGGCALIEPSIYENTAGRSVSALYLPMNSALHARESGRWLVGTMGTEYIQNDSKKTDENKYIIIWNAPKARYNLIYGALPKIGQLDSIKL